MPAVFSAQGLFCELNAVSHRARQAGGLGGPGCVLTGRPGGRFFKNTCLTRIG